MVQFLYIVSLLGSVVGAATLFLTISGAKGAPQEAAGAAIAMALAVLPYVFARSVQLTVERRERRQHEERVIDRLDAMQRASERT